MQGALGEGEESQGNAGGSASARGGGVKVRWLLGSLHEDSFRRRQDPGPAVLSLGLIPKQVWRMLQAGGVHGGRWGVANVITVGKRCYSSNSWQDRK